jgi:predicted lysophospholipase L1 biosynthesis ABC-type transport system permease subunit
MPYDAPPPPTKVAAGPDGLRVDYNAGVSDEPLVARADVPENLPVVVAGSTSLDPIGRDNLVLTRDLGGGHSSGSVQGHVQAAPRLGPSGVLLDLESALRVRPRVDPNVTYEVWAAAGADVDGRLAERLSEAGLHVRGRETVVERAAALDRSGTALALLLLLGVALAALLVSTATVVLSALSTGHRRAFEIAALRTAGVSRSALRGAVDREYGGLIGIGTACGLVSGAVTAAVAGPAVALLGVTGPIAPGNETVSWLPVVAVAVCGITIYAVVAAVCARLAVRSAGSDVLREVAA